MKEMVLKGNTSYFDRIADAITFYNKENDPESLSEIQNFLGKQGLKRGFIEGRIDLNTLEKNWNGEEMEIKFEYYT